MQRANEKKGMGLGKCTYEQDMEESSKNRASSVT
jgi:hypothetical protein